MSKESRRLGREEIKELRKQRKKAAKALREKQQAQGLLAPVKVAMPNRKSAYKNVEEESRYSRLFNGVIYFTLSLKYAPLC